MDILLNVVNYIVNLGAAVFLPVIMFIIGLIFGLKPGKSFRSGLMLGIAFTAISTFISALLVGQIAPAAQSAIERAGSNLQYMDVGWTAASMISWAWPFAATIFPLQIVINLLMLWLKWTDTLNVDLWNVWTKIFIAAVTYIFTGNLIVAYIVAAVVIVIELKLGDFTAERIQKSTGIPDVTCTHSGMMSLLPVMPLIWLIDRIPGLKDKKFDAESLKNKMGFLGEPAVLGLIMGIIMGLLGGYNVADTLKLAIKVAAVMIVLPRLASLFSEALMPISEAAAQFMQKRFPGRKCYIGLDWPILTANPAVVTSSVLLIPVLIILALILPGNKTLPFGDVANFACLVIGPAILFGGDIIKTCIASIPILTVTLYASTAIGPTFTKLAQNVGFAFPEGSASITYLKAGPVIWATFEGVLGHWYIAIPLVILFAFSFVILKKSYTNTLKAEE
ncbi:PTS galactitol transporter subunit IIC [Anaerocolumna xylanovorans]|uniref:PTS system, galactitol-specific IIC component n=1 Tax=Anaerocolumna xylanovorans DSM 12503 TaxID=1121345 RepID=A0A1M7YDC5_9FIRM|nr:PTS transporter subunit IIC [Anaerocolumna xylanovorans]SHO50637.1 PTS system, galactitol-specific IIC component [Anaerocolumna xylanovorans DSM 12503]